MGCDKRELGIVAPAGILGHGVEALEILVGIEESVVAQEGCCGVEALPGIVDERGGGAVALIVVHAYLDGGTGSHAVAGLELHVAGICEVALGHVVRTFVEVDLLYYLGHEEVQIGISLAMCVAHHVDGHAVDSNVDVGAVVKVESAQEHLLGLAAAGMLGYEQAGHKAEHFLRRAHGVDLEVEVHGIVEMAYLGRNRGYFMKAYYSVGERGRVVCQSRKCCHDDNGCKRFFHIGSYKDFQRVYIPNKDI